MEHGQQHAAIAKSDASEEQREERAQPVERNRTAEVPSVLSAEMSTDPAALALDELTGFVGARGSTPARVNASGILCIVGAL